MKNQAFFNNPEISSKWLICAAPSLSHGIRARNLARTSQGIANAQNHLEGHHNMMVLGHCEPMMVLGH